MSAQDSQSSQIPVNDEDEGQSGYKPVVNMISKSSNFWVAGSNCHIVIHGTEQNHGSEQPRADEHTEMTPEDPMEIQLTSRQHQSGSMPLARVHNNDDSDSDSDEVKHFCAQMSHQYELSINQKRVADRAPGDRMMLHRDIARAHQVVGDKFRDLANYLRVNQSR